MDTGAKETMKNPSLIFGIISSNMVMKTPATPPSCIQNIHCIDKDFFVQHWALMISSDMVNKIHFLKNTEFTPKQIKTLLINEIAMTLRDLEAIQSAELPRRPFHNHEIKIGGSSEKLILSVFPSKSPTPYLIDKALGNDDQKTNAEYVFWSTSSYEETKMKVGGEDPLCLHFLCKDTVGYQDFLIFFSKNHLKHNKCRIDFEIFMYNKPIIFGKATCVQLDSKQNTIFYFSRLLNCSAVKSSFIH